jgi:hypothetical protein
MKRANGTSMMPILRAYFTSDSSEVCDRLAGRIAEFVIEKAIAGHFGYFKLVLDFVDGKLYQTAEDEMTFEPDCVLILADDLRDSVTALAA